MTHNNATPPDVRVLVAEDSATVRWHLVDMINATAGLRVVGEARDGEEVLALVAQLRPDVISMDISMPRMDGLEATRRLMMQTPTPVVVVSGLVDKDMELSFQALKAGALAVVEKPPDRRNPTFEEKERLLVKMLMAMARVKVIRRGTDLLHSADTYTTQDAFHPEAAATTRYGISTPEIIALGASAGGPSALSNLLQLLPQQLPVPVVIVQHLPNEFIMGLARWLGKSSGWAVEVVEDGAILKPGVVHLSPGTAHLLVTRHAGQLVARLEADAGNYRYQPAIDLLFESIARTCGAGAVGVVLTGMGDDGAAGLLAMRQAGARTFAQDRQSSIVFGMPNAAIERGAVETVLPLVQLPAAIAKLF